MSDDDKCGITVFGLDTKGRTLYLDLSLCLDGDDWIGINYKMSLERAKRMRDALDVAIRRIERA